MLTTQWPPTPPPLSPLPPPPTRDLPSLVIFPIPNFHKMHRKPNTANNKKPSFLPKINRPRLLLIPMLAFFLLLTILLLLNPNPSLSSSIPPQIQQACRSTLFPSLCISSLSSLSPAPSSPADIILSALSLSSHDLDTARSLSQSILSSSQSIPARKNAALNCLDHLSLSSRRLSATPPSLSPPPSLSAARAFAGAALLYQYDCWSALKYVNNTHQVASAMSFLANLTSLTSNALAMISALQRYGDDLSSWAPPQTERDGYWPDPGGDADENPVIGFPTDLTADVTVCKPTGCDYETVQDAVNAAPDFGLKRFVIRISAGVYDEVVRVPFEKTNVVLLGDGMGRTVITGKLNAQMTGVTTYNTATVGVAGDGFMAKDLTFENAAGPGAHQAVAFRSDSDRSVLHSVEFLSHQDTLYARSLRQFYHSCRVSGTVDFIFGNSASMFYNCSIVVVPRQEGPEKGESNAVTAHGRTDPGQATGFVFEKCSVDGSEEYVEIYRKRPGRHKVYLGRPWKEYSRTVFLNCYMGEMVRPERWMPWRGEFALRTLFYGEFGSSGPGANSSSRVEWSSQIPAEHLGVYSVSNFIQGDGWLTSG